jgi:isocitrate lyase
MNRSDQIYQLEKDWGENPRWEHAERPYSAKEVVNLRGQLNVEYTLAKNGANKFWDLLQKDTPVSALGALTGNQAIQQVQAGLQAIYCSGWQVAADNNTSDTMYPDQSLYPMHSVPKLVERINNALLRTSEIYWMKDDNSVDWVAPIIADAEAGFGGNLNAFELMKLMIKAGAACVHFEDQLSSVKKCGHMGGKVVVPTQEFINKLVSARLASDVMGVPTVIIARTDSNAAKLITSDADERDKKFIVYDKEKSPEGFYYINNGIDLAIDRGVSYSPYSDVLWCETSKPNVDEAKKFAEGVFAKYPNKLLSYNCSPSFNWSKNLSADDIKTFREQLFALGYKYQFITLAGWHALNMSMFSLSKQYLESGMYGYSRLQDKEFETAKDGFRAAKHQEFVGAGYFDRVQETIMGGDLSTAAMTDSTEEEQFDS